VTTRPGLNATVIVSAAADLADDKGLDQLTLASLAANLGVRTPSLYNHIGGLPGLKKELAVHAVKELTAEFGQAAIGKSADDAVRAILFAYRDMAKERPGLYDAAIRVNYTEDEKLQAATRDLIEVILKVLVPYNLDEDTEIHVIRAIRSIAHGFVSLEVAGLFKGRLLGRPLDPSESYRLLVEAFLRGFHSMRNISSEPGID